MTRGATLALAWLAGGCVPAPGGTGDAGCGPPRAAPGEARARRITCNEDRVPGGEGRIGDWILENAVARFVVRAHPGALYLLDGPDPAVPGDTLLDAVRLTADADGRAVADGPDLLAELVPDGPSVRLSPRVGASGAGLVDATGTRGWFLPPDTDRLRVLGAPDATWIPAADAVRIAAGAVRDDFVLLLDGDGSPVPGGHVPVGGLRAVALSATGRWPDAVSYAGTADADAVDLIVDGSTVLRTPVRDGAWSTEGPPGADPRGWRRGCTYESDAGDAGDAGGSAPLTPVRCVARSVRVTDGDGRDLAAQVVTSVGRWPLPPGGGRVPDDAAGWLWAGPAWEASPVDAGETPVEARLAPAMPMDGWMLADLAVEVAPDTDATETPVAARDARAAEGVDAVVLLADDDVPPPAGNGGRTPRGEVVAVTGSRTAGWLWSWPWTPTTRRAGHGAVPWRRADGTPRAALDQLAAARGLPGEPRRTVVTAAWVDAARAEAPPHAWRPRPDALWLDGPDDVAVLAGLLQAWIPVAPVGPRTWVPVEAARDRVALDRAVIDATTSTGSGPRLRWLPPRCAPGEALRRGAGPPPPRDEDADARWRLRAEAPAWAGLARVELFVGDPAGGVQRRRVAWTPGEDVVIDVPEPCGHPGDGPAWMVAVATGRRAHPWSRTDGTAPAWAVSDVAWLRSPADAGAD
ncbi:MAG: hypothetical protein RLZZ299_543 [Pseudomonadota bacterium]